MERPPGEFCFECIFIVFCNGIRYVAKSEGLQALCCLGSELKMILRR